MPASAERAALDAERGALGAIAAGRPLGEVLAAIVRAARATVSGAPWGSLLVGTSDGSSLVPGHIDDLPPALREAMSAGMRIGAAGPPCARAAHRRRFTVVDAGSDELLGEDLRAVIDADGVASSWSAPIVSADKHLLGVLSLFHDGSRKPSKDERRDVERVADIARIALELSRQEQARAASADPHRALAELTSDFAYSFALKPDGSAELEWITDAFSQATGYSVEEFAALGGWAGLIHPDDLLAFQQRVPRLIEGEEVAGEYRIKTKGDDVRWLHISTKPVIDPATGRVTRIVGAAHDFTARKEAEDAKTMFLATASHELKTPLTVIRGFAQLLEGKAGEDELRREAAETIERRSMQLAKIVDRILLSSRIETGRSQVKVEAVDLMPILTELTEAYATATSRTVDLTVSDDLPLVLADAEGAVTVIDHVLDNAVKYSPDGSDIRVSASVAGNRVAVEVRDQGVGMTADELARCFEKFWQAESSDSRRFGGTGIGLYIVRSLVEGMGGLVSAESEPGAGTTIRMRFQPAEADETTKRGADGGSAGRGEDTSIREFMRQLGISMGGKP